MQSALDYLRRTQDVSGSWSSDALSTAVALKFVGTASGAQPDTDGDGISDALELLLGTDPNRADAKLLALGNEALQSPAGPDTMSLTYAMVRGAAANINLPIASAATCCTTTSGSLPAGVTLSASGSCAAHSKRLSHSRAVMRMAVSRMRGDSGASNRR